MQQTTKNLERVEVRSILNDNVVATFEHTSDESVNMITLAYNKICERFRISRFIAEQRYYVTKP